MHFAQADVVVHPLHQLDFYVQIERFEQKRDVFMHELLLQRDCMGGDDGALPFMYRPEEGREEIGEAFSRSGARLNKRDMLLFIR